MDVNNHRGVNLVSDGKTLAMRWDHQSFVMERFAITELRSESTMQDFNIVGDPFPIRKKTGERVHIQLSSVGPVKVGPAHALDNLFLNANELSVDELLKLAYQKIDARAEAESSA